MRCGRDSRRCLILWLLALTVLIMGTAFPALAATRRPIRSISLSFKADIRPGMDFGEETVEITGGGDRFSVDGYTVLNKGFAWGTESVPELEVTLSANSDYYFDAIGADKLRLKGGGAVYISGVRRDSGQTLVMRVRLAPLGETVWEIGQVTLAADGMARWDKVSTAGSYEVRILRDGKSTGAVLTAGNAFFDCSGRMKRSGSYEVRVRPVSRLNAASTGRWSASDPVYVDEETARSNREREHAGGTEQAAAAAVWRRAESGAWWYDRGDGSYPAGGWEEIGGKWYYFDEAGWMKTGWIRWQGNDYYCADSGEMLINTETPDSGWAGADGAVRDGQPGDEDGRKSDF